jgi:membrane protease YdiL (CAAX protease family)
MSSEIQPAPKSKSWGSLETVFVLWAGLALAALLPVTLFLRGSFPVLTVAWLAVPLLAVIFTREAARAGFRPIPWREFLVTAGINLGLLLLLAVLAEPWSHAYGDLVRAAVAGSPPDTTFAWLVRFTGLPAWGGLLLYSGLVTIFGEELFFRGWLLQALLRKMGRTWAILLQAALFTLPQLLAALLLLPLQGAIYGVVYSFLGVGVIGGWAAWRTRSIWPSLTAAAIWNVMLSAWAMMAK